MANPSPNPFESFISLLFSGSVYFLQKFTDRTGLKVDGESIAQPSCIPSYNLLHNCYKPLQNFTLSSILLLPTLNLSEIYSLSQKDEVRLGIGHRASGIGHRASGIGHRASGIPHFFEKGYINLYLLVYIVNFFTHNSLKISEFISQIFPQSC